MAQTTLVKERIDEGQRLLDQLIADQFPITAACWIRAIDDDTWRLYIATPLAELPDNQAYRAIVMAMQNLAPSSLGWRDIKAIGPTHSVTLDILDNQRRFAPEILKHYRNSRLGDLYIEEAYIYPPLKLGRMASTP
jgi:hypothetical protein